MVEKDRSPASIFSNMRQNLENARADHSEFNHLYVTTGVFSASRSVLTAKACNQEVLLIKKESRDLCSKNPEQIHNLSLRRSKIFATGRLSRYFGVVHGLNTPAITNLRAIKNWRPGRFDVEVYHDMSEEGKRKIGRNFVAYETVAENHSKKLEVQQCRWIQAYIFFKLQIIEQ